MRLLSIIIILTVILSSGCKDGGIMADNDAVIADSASLRGVIRVNMKLMSTPIMVDGALVSLHEGQSAEPWYPMKIFPDGSFCVYPFEVEWKPGDVFAEDNVEIAQDLSLPTNVILLPDSDGGFYLFGAGNERYSSSKQTALVKFDKDCNVVYQLCEFYDVNNNAIPCKAIPLGDGRCALLIRCDSYYTENFEYVPEEWNIRLIDKDGSTISISKVEIDLSESSVTTSKDGSFIYSCGDVLFFDCKSYDGEHHYVQSFDLNGKLLYQQEQDVFAELRDIIYTGNATILSYLHQDYEEQETEYGTTNVAIGGHFFYTKIRSSHDIEVKKFNGADSSYVLTGGVQCGSDEILYGYCIEKFVGADHSYSTNEVAHKGLIVKNDEVITFGGRTVKYILGVWEENGLYTIYYKELQPEVVDKENVNTGWDNFVCIYQTDDLKKLEN
ncbi:MAG: hypothetical protein II480_09255 [Bacteroidales bacterium]|nr:hypothetical protein [Bacteroidales bacterium]